MFVVLIFLVSMIGVAVFGVLVGMIAGFLGQRTLTLRSLVLGPVAMMLFFAAILVYFFPPGRFLFGTAAQMPERASEIRTWISVYLGWVSLGLVPWFGGYLVGWLLIVFACRLRRACVHPASAAA